MLILISVILFLVLTSSYIANKHLFDINKLLATGTTRREDIIKAPIVLLDIAIVTDNKIVEMKLIKFAFIPDNLA